MKKIALHWQIVIGLILGVVYALLSAQWGWGWFTADYVAPWGRIFINLLKLIAVPLVLFSIVGGIAGLGSPKQLGSMGLKTLLLYISTSLFAIGLGLGIAVLAKPGRSIDERMVLENRIGYELWAKSEKIALADGLSVTTDPEHAALVETVKLRLASTTNDVPATDVVKSTQARGPLSFVEDWVPGNLFIALSDNREMLKVIFFALLMGISILFVPKEKVSGLMGVIDGLTVVFIKMVEGIMMVAPFFVFALMASTISQQAGDDPTRVWELFKGLGLYSVCVLLGLAMVAYVVYPLIIRFFAKNPFLWFLKGISPAQLLAFSSSSSAATLPVTMDCAENRLGIDKRVVSFVLPIGSTVNMDGTSLYQAVAVVFLAQMHGIVLGFDAYVTILFTTVLASIGAAAIPGAGVVMLMVILSSVGLNPAWIAIILPVDRILDMFRTVVNVTGDVMVALLVDKTTRAKSSSTQAG
jgi:Na+/H+-dicarboxylate symporter